MRARRILALVALATLALASCEAGERDDGGVAAPSVDASEGDRSGPSGRTDGSQPGPSKDPSPGGPRERARTEPRRAKLTITALGRGRLRSRQAVADLKKLGFWPPLTRHVTEVVISTRAGRGSIPEDGHLADAIMNVQLGNRPGYVCDVMIFTTALADDVGRQEGYYSTGSLQAPPPTLREFWAVILAHELAHCSERGQRGEAYSTRWEKRVLAAYDSARLGS